MLIAWPMQGKICLSGTPNGSYLLVRAGWRKDQMVTRVFLAHRQLAPDSTLIGEFSVRLPAVINRGGICRLSEGIALPALFAAEQME